jgi:hypothetical protein
VPTRSPSAERLSAFELSVEMPPSLWDDARGIQLALARIGDDRRGPPADHLLAVAAQHAPVVLASRAIGPFPSMIVDARTCHKGRTECPGSRHIL